MEFRNLTELSETDKKEIFALWNNEYPEKLNYNTFADFEIYLKNLNSNIHTMVIDENGKIKGWSVIFNRDNEKWFAIILDSELQGRGLGKKILSLAKEKEMELNGWVIDHDKDKKKNGETYKSPLDFYLKNGFDIISDHRLELRTISAVKINWKNVKPATPFYQDV